MFKKGKRVFYVHQSSFLGHSKFTHGTHAPSIVNFFVSGWGPGRSWRQRLNTWIGCPCLLVTGYCRWEQCSCPSFICCGELDRCVIIQLGLASLEKGDTLSRLLYFWVIISEEFDLNLFGHLSKKEKREETMSRCGSKASIQKKAFSSKCKYLKCFPEGA